MRNKIRINEATFKKIIAESVKGVLNEISPELMGAAAMTAIKRAKGYEAGSPKFRKYMDQSSRLAKNTEDAFLHQNPAVDDVSFNPVNRDFTARFSGRDVNGNTIEYSGNNNRLNPNERNGHFYGLDPSSTVFGMPGYYDTRYSENQVANNFSNRDLRRYEKFKDQCRDMDQRLQDFQPQD